MKKMVIACNLFKESMSVIEACEVGKMILDVLNKGVKK
jgi:glycerate kinase